MQWRRFDQAEVPTDKVFLVSVGDDIFFARSKCGHIALKETYAEAVAFEFPEYPYEGTEAASVFKHRNKTRGTFPMWSHLHKPELLK